MLFLLRMTLSRGKYTCNNDTTFFKYGSLSDFFDSPECTFKIIPYLVSQSLKLYRKIIKNDVYCIDVKPPNMLVTESYKIYLIDFGEDFCSSKESKYTIKIIFTNMLKSL